MTRRHRIRSSRVLTDRPQLKLTRPVAPRAAIHAQHDTVLNANDVVRLAGDPVEGRNRFLGCRPLPTVGLGTTSVSVEVTVRVERLQGT